MALGLGPEILQWIDAMPETACLCAALTTAREVHRPFTSSQSVCVVGRPQRICVVWLQVTTSDVNMAKFLRPRPRPIFLVSDRSCPKITGYNYDSTPIRRLFDGAFDCLSEVIIDITR